MTHVGDRTRPEGGAEAGIAARLLALAQAPFRSIRSLRTKLALIVVAAIFAAAAFQTVGYRLNIPWQVRPFIMASAAFVVVRLLSKGTITPLVRMEAAAAQLASGDHQTPIQIAGSTPLGDDEIGRLAVTFERMRTDLVAVDRQRRDLIANVSHELRTPLAAARGHLENMADGVTEPSEPALRALLDQLERLGTLVADLMDLSQLEAGVSRIHVSSVLVSDVVDNAIGEFHLAHIGSVVKADIAQGLRADLDAERFHRVILNLLTNAARFSPADEPILVEACEDPPGSTVHIRVCDRGVGIAPHHRSEVFRRFYRADAARSSDSGGVGLGLAIVNEIVQLHGGSVAAEARSGGGCVMHIQLPMGAVSTVASTRTGS